MTERAKEGKGRLIKFSAISAVKSSRQAQGGDFGEERGDSEVK
jgi:hypothetical protein